MKKEFWEFVREVVADIRWWLLAMLVLSVIICVDLGNAGTAHRISVPMWVVVIVFWLTLFGLSVFGFAWNSERKEERR